MRFAAAFERSSAGSLGKLFEAYLEAIAGDANSGKWNSFRLMKWCKDPLASKRLSSILTHDINIGPRAVSQPAKPAARNDPIRRSPRIRRMETLADKVAATSKRAKEAARRSQSLRGESALLRQQSRQLRAECALARSGRDGDGTARVQSRLTMAQACSVLVA